MPLKGEARKAWRRNYEKTKRRSKKPFVAIDSEGVSYGEKIPLENGDLAQAQKTVFWGAGNETSGTSFLTAADGASPFLSSEEIIDWLLDLPKEFGPSIFVWFGSSYDATQIFADLPYEKAWEIQHGEPFEKKEGVETRKRQGRYTLWKNYAFSYLKQKCLKIGELRDADKPRGKTGNFVFKRQIVIYDVFGFFQASFIKSAQSIPGAMTEKEFSIILKGKADRETFSLDNLQEMMRYTTAELFVLARMMESLRVSFETYGLKLTRWQGAGSIAGALFNLHKTREHFAALVSRDLPIAQQWAHRAFFGGRIECLKQGKTTRRLFNYDVRSAYPAHMAGLPSMKMGEFIEVAGPVSRETVENASKLSMFQIRFHVDCDNDGPLSLNKIYGLPGPDFYPLPYRDDKGRITYPPSVYGIYMQAEASAAFVWIDRYSEFFQKRHNVLLPVKISIERALIFKPFDETIFPFSWLEAMYRERRSIVKEAKRTGSYNVIEKVIKLGINSAYGKTAQSVGSVGEPPSTACPWVAAAITAGTRAQLMLAALTASPGSVVAFQTDGIVSTRRLVVDEGEALGQWEMGEVGGPGTPASIFVQPGVYYFDAKSKHRGIKLDLLGVDKFETWLEANAVPAWRDGRESVRYPYRYYVTLGNAVASRDRFSLAGFWVDGQRELRLDNLGYKRAAPLFGEDRKARADKLVDTLPKSALFHELLEFELPLSAIYRPDWLDPELGAETELERLNEEIALTRE